MHDYLIRNVTTWSHTSQQGINFDDGSGNIQESVNATDDSVSPGIIWLACSRDADLCIIGGGQMACLNVSKAYATMGRYDLLGSTQA